MAKKHRSLRGTLPRQMTVLQVSRIVADGKYNVGEGVYLQVTGVARSWLFRYQRDGKDRWLGLGSTSLVTLAEARRKGWENRRKLLDGEVPNSAKAARRAKPA